MLITLDVVLLMVRIVAFIRVRDKEVVKSVAKELRVPMTKAVDTAVKVLRIIVRDDELFYIVVTAVHLWDEKLARELIAIREGSRR